MGYWENQRVRLGLKWPFGRTLLLAALILAAAMVILEILARSNFVQRRVPFQAYGSNHIQFEMQMANLETFVSQHGAPDCLILGNSQSLRGVDPEILMQSYQEQTGEALLCYNFSVVGANLATTRLFSEMLVDRYDLKLIILGASFLDFTEEQEYRWDKRFLENDWLAYQLGDWSLRGWVMAHSYAFRLVTYASYGAPRGFKFDEVNKEVNKWRQQLTIYGRGSSRDRYSMAEAIKPGFLQSFLGQFGDYTVSPLNLDSLERIIQLAQQEGIQIVIVEMPCHPTLIALPDENKQPHAESARVEAFAQQVNLRVQEIAGRNQSPFWTVEALDSFPDSAWHDRYHLNNKGSALFTQWLAARLVEAIAQGELQDLSYRK